LQFRVYGLSFRIWLDVVLRTGEGEEKKNILRMDHCGGMAFTFFGGGEKEK
jgi:hypothetical protein